MSSGKVDFGNVVTLEFRNQDLKYVERIPCDEDLHFGEYKARWARV